MAKHELKALNVVLQERRVMDLMDNLRMLNLAVMLSETMYLKTASCSHKKC